jgi:voltage-gated potassium channel Kch
VLFDILLMLGGALLMALVYAFITDLVVGAKIEPLLGLRTAARRHHVGYRCALDLQRQGVPVVVIEPDEGNRFSAAARAAGLTVLTANAQSEDALYRAGIRYARALLCATSDDQVNVEVGVLARGLHPDLHVVLRVFDPVFAAQVRAQLGIPATFSAAVLAAPGFAAAALDRPDVAVLPAELPGVPGVPLRLRSLPRSTSVATSNTPSTSVATSHEATSLQPGAHALVADLCDPASTPLALLHPDGRCTLAPSPELPLSPGDSVLIAGAPPA